VQLYGITLPLLTRADGTKMGKTEAGAVWLSAEKTSPYAFYQYWINLADDDAGTCLRMLTELDRAEIEALDQTRREEPHLRQSQRRLAQTLTELVHGAEGLAKAEQATQVFFGAEITRLTDRELLEIFADVPSRDVPRARLLDGGLSLIDALVLAGLARSNGEARRVIEQGGAYVNNRRRTAWQDTLSASDLAGERVAVLRSGKKRYALLRFVDEPAS
jgi:tyrosyl-tRNA synthetase